MNCGHMTIIVRADTYRFVSTCEHGTIHLNWDLATLHLHAHNFERLVDLLKQAKTAPDLPRINGESYYSLIRQANDCWQLWVGDVGLFLTPTDFLPFADLVINAQQRLGKTLPQPSPAVLFREHQPAKSRSTSYSCRCSRN